MAEGNLDMVRVEDFELKQLELLGMDVNKFTEKKKNLTYLSWSHAWEEFVKVFPKATYQVRKDHEGNAFFGRANIGYMVFTTVQVMDIEREMWLLVMDGANNALKDEPYEYTTKYGTKKVEAMDMFDVNKTIMRCLVKNLAMFGLGLYIYKGEDLPTDVTKEKKQAGTPNINPKTPANKTGKIIPTPTAKAEDKGTVKPDVKLGLITDKQKARIHILMEESGSNKENIYSFFKIKSSTELDAENADEMISMLLGIKIKQNGKSESTQISQIVALLKKKGYTKKSLLLKHKMKSLDEMTYKLANSILEGLRKLEDKN